MDDPADRPNEPAAAAPVPPPLTPEMRRILGLDPPLPPARPSFRYERAAQWGITTFVTLIVLEGVLGVIAKQALIVNGFEDLALGPTGVLVVIIVSAGAALYAGLND